MQRCWIIWLLVLGIGCGARVDTTTQKSPHDLRVTSFNVRYSRAKDEHNAWPLRRDVFFVTLQRAGADLFGMQEVLADQAAEIRAALPEYGFVGVGRNDGKEQGEFAPILFKSNRFELLDSGHFWLSPTPDAIGSKGWDADLTRIVTWVKLRDRRAADRTLVVFNTHWDHLGKVARVESAKLMRQRMAALAGDLPVIVTGDFNCTEDDPPYAILVRGDVEPKLADAFRTVHPERSREESTFGGFMGTRVGSRIDWILHSPHFRARPASIDRFNAYGRYPSDHYPVHAALAWRNGGSN